MASQPNYPKESPENQSLSKTEFQLLLQANMRFKARSYDTYHETHLLELHAKRTGPIETVLIGDSMLERLKTTGMHSRTAQLPSSFNAGVGGDKIENVLFRLDLGMLSLLEERNVKLWVIMVGTNNLKKALRPVEVERYRLLIQALLRISPTSKIIACKLFKRKDIDDRYVEESNGALLDLVKEMNENLGERIYVLEAPTGVTKEHLTNHVHLDEEGYEIWDGALYPLIGKLLGNI